MRPAPRFATVEFVFEIEAGLYGANEAQKGGASTTARVRILGTPADALRASAWQPSPSGFQWNFAPRGTCAQARDLGISVGGLAKPKYAAADEGWWGWGESNSRHAV